MLASITPLGERSRGSTYAVTAAAFVIGATAGGALVGAALGSLGHLALASIGGRARLIALVVIAIATLVLEAWRLPTIERQVNEEWMHSYRGWVYGAGYGFQLGAGIMTVVTSGAIYATLAAEMLSAGAFSGFLVGIVFGLLRGASLLAGSAIRTPRALVTLDAALRKGERPASWMARSGQAAVVIVCLGWLVR